MSFIHLIGFFSRSLLPNLCLTLLLLNLWIVVWTFPMVVHFAGYMDSCCLYLSLDVFSFSLYDSNQDPFFKTTSRTSTCVIYRLPFWLCLWLIFWINPGLWQTWSKQASCIPKCSNFYGKQVNFPPSVNAVLY